jgi:hypothetical protein
MILNVPPTINLLLIYFYILLSLTWPSNTNFEFFCFLYCKVQGNHDSVLRGAKLLTRPGAHMSRDGPDGQIFHALYKEFKF